MEKSTANKVDYHQAAKRHFSDAELLLEHGRQANAGQLYGFVAECGLKSLLVWHGCPTDPATGDIAKTEKTYRRHINKLTEEIAMVNAFLDGRGAATYLAKMPNITNFLDWTTDHRYYAVSALPTSIAHWREASHEVMRMLEDAMLDGVMT